MTPNQELPHESNHIDLSKISAELIGKKLGEFEVIKEIGRGGTSTVYEAIQLSLKRPVALKVLWRPLAKDPNSVERFHHEAEAVANLHHPNIVPIFAMGHQDDLIYFAMEKIDGETLEELILQQNSFDCKKAVQIIKYVARAVSYAHQKQIVHRDIKPSNIMIDTLGRILVTDFGLAKSKKWTKMTSENIVVGTPVYMSPEQAQGKETDFRTDIYSMGVVLYEMVTGEVPFYADETVAILRKVIEEKPKPPRSIKKDIPKNIETIILKCIEKEPNNRYQAAGLFLRDLELSKMNLPLIANRSQITIFSGQGRKNIVKIILSLLISIVISSSAILLYNTHKGYIDEIKTGSFLSKISNFISRRGRNKTPVKTKYTGNMAESIEKELADVLYLDNDIKVMGIIESADEDSVTVRLKIGTLTYPKKDIIDIHYSTPAKRDKLRKLWQVSK
jgi:serine/threonine protein kinase